MLRFYFMKAGAREDEMSVPSVMAWTVCRKVTEKLSEAERDVVRTHFTQTWEDTTAATPYVKTAERYGLTVNETRRIIDRCVRMVAVERGLADE